MAVVIAIDAGTTGVRAMAVGPGWPSRRGPLPGVPAVLPPARDGSSTTPRRSGRPWRPPWRAARTRSTSPWPPSASPTSARPSWCGIGAPARPRHRAIVWQDRRGAPLCESLEAAGHLELVRARTGLVLDPYFSATKLTWLLTEGGVEAGPDLAFGTVDSWLLWRLTGGAVHATDPDQRLAHPAVRHRPAGSGTRSWPTCSACRCRPCPRWARPVAGSGPRPRGWSPACPPACRSAGWPATSRPPSSARPASSPGMTKNTYGTGSFVLMNVGADPPEPVPGLLTTVAWSLAAPDRVAYALEGAIFVTGAAVQWLRDELGLIASAAEIGPLAESVRRHRRGLPGARPDRTRQPVVGPARPGRARRCDPGRRAGAAGPGGGGGHGLPDPRRGRRHAGRQRPTASPSSGSTGARR